MRREQGTATVEALALSLLLAALLAVVIVQISSSPPTEAARSLDSLLARRLRCAPAEPAPCWQDPLTVAYGRSVAGAVRALAPPPVAVAAPDGLQVAPVDFRYCRHEACAVPGPRAGLTVSNRRMTAFTSIADRRRSGGELEIDYWLYRPGLGWTRVTRRLTTADVERYAGTPLLEADIPTLVPLETLSGRDSFQFSTTEEPPWQGLIRTVYPG